MDQTQSQKTTESKKDTAVYEVHLIVSPEDEPAMFLILQDIKTLEEGFDQFMDVHATCARSFYGDFPIQPMITYKIQSTPKVAVDTAQRLKDLLKSQCNLNVLRLKVECQSVGSPLSPQEVLGDRYFEFHFKVPITNSRMWQEVHKICLPFGAPLFFNPYRSRSELNAIVTLRRYDTSYKSALADLNKLRALLEKYLISDKITKECSVLDTNVNMDKGWLFAGENPKQFITS